jgi:hypothetical protein
MKGSSQYSRRVFSQMARCSDVKDGHRSAGRGSGAARGLARAFQHKATAMTDSLSLWAEKVIHEPVAAMRELRQHRK